MFDDRDYADLGWVNELPKQAKRFPLTDIFVNEDENILIDIAVAGFAKENISIEMVGNTLVITGEYVSEGRDDLKVIQEFISKQNFERNIVLSENYVEGAIIATLDNGILSIGVTKNAQSKKTITIH